MKLYDRVYKKSKKPFQHGKKVGTIMGFIDLVIPEKSINKPAAVIWGCNGAVALEVLRNDPKVLEVMEEIDRVKISNTTIDSILQYNHPI